MAPSQIITAVHKDEPLILDMLRSIIYLIHQQREHTFVVDLYKSSASWWVPVPPFRFAEPRYIYRSAIPPSVLGTMSMEHGRFRKEDLMLKTELVESVQIGRK